MWSHGLMNMLHAFSTQAGNWPATLYLIKKDKFSKLDKMAPVFAPYKAAYLDPFGSESVVCFQLYITP